MDFSTGTDDIVVQRYNNKGQRVGTQIVVNTTLAGDQIDPDVAMDDFGNFVVVWSGPGSDGLPGIQARMFDAYGTAGLETTVSTIPLVVQDKPSVAMRPDGNFVVTWTRYNNSGNKYGNVIGRTYNGLGTATSGEVVVSTTATRNNEAPDVAIADNGSIIVVWRGFTPTTSNWDIYGQRLNANGTKAGGEFQLNSSNINIQTDPRVSMDAAGNFVGVWQSWLQDGNEYGVYAHRYSAVGLSQGSEFLVNQTTLNRQYQPDVAMANSGDFTIVWTAFGQDNLLTKDYGIYGRMFSTTGTALAGEFRINATTSGNQVTPVVSRNADNGDFVVVWAGPDLSLNGIYARLLRQTAVTVDTVSPTSAVASLSATSTSPTLSVKWSGADNGGGTGVAAYTVYVSTNGGVYTPWQSNTTATAATFTGQTGNTYSFYSVAADKAGNIEAVPLAADTTTVVGSSTGGTGGGTTTTATGTTIGSYNPATSTFSLRNANSAGSANTSFVFGSANAGFVPITGDWDGNGTETVGVYNPKTGTFYLRNSNTAGAADLTFTFGGVNSTYRPVVGDWAGTGKDSVGVYNPSTSTFSLKNSATVNNGYVSFAFGAANGGYLPVAGDWDGDGKDTIGLYRTSTKTFTFRNANSAGLSNATFVFSGAASTWKPIAGDWNADGKDSIGLYDPATAKYYLRNALTAGGADTSFAFGSGNMAPIAGNWTGSSHALMASGGQASGQGVSSLTKTQLAPLVNEAIARWASAGVNSATAAKLAAVEFIVTDLPDGYLGRVEGNRVYIDNNAAGYGWFVDSTPTVDEEFAPVSGAQLRAVSSKAVSHVDLLTVLEHELGHIAGLDDIDAMAGDVMSGSLGRGVRRDVTHQDAVDAIFAQ